MKFFKKIFLPVLAAVCAFAVCLSFAACTETTETPVTEEPLDKYSKYADENDDTNWDYTTYVIYLELPDGASAADVYVQICSGSNCLPTRTNEDGRASVTFPSSQQNQKVYIHFNDKYDSNYENIIGYDIPECCEIPNGSTEQDGKAVWFLNEKVTTLKFVAA